MSFCTLPPGAILEVESRMPPSDGKRTNPPNVIVPNGFEANFTLGFLKGLTANGVSLVVLSCDDTASKLDRADIPHINVRGSLKEDRPLAQKIINLARYYLRTMALLFRHKGGTVHFTGILDKRRILIDGLLLHLWARLTAKRYVYTVHNVLPHGREKSRFYRAFYRLAYRVPHVLIVHTPAARAQLLREFDVPAKKIHLSSLGLNEEMPITSLTSDEARRRLGFRAEDKVILSFGRLDEYKGVDLLVAAFDQLPIAEARLLIAGPFGNATYRGRVLDGIATARRSDDIQLHEGFVSNEEGEVFFKASNVLCLPYRNIYQSGLVFLAPRFGLPIVTTDVGSMREFIGEDMGLIARSNDVPGIRDALTAFFGRQENFQKEHIQQVGRKYRWETICRSLLPYYQSAPETVLAA